MTRHLYIGHFAAPLLLLCAACSSTQSPVSEPIEPVSGWIEAVAIVRDLEPIAEFLAETAGYKLVHAGPTPRPVLEAWQLPPSASARELVFAEPGARRGLIRLVQLAGVGRQIEMRSAGQFFDTGGLFGLNVRVFDIDLAFERLQAAGWRALSDPVRFAVEEFAVAEAIFVGPNGLVIGLIEREKPALGPQWQMPPGQPSRPNNAIVVTSDLPAMLDFYTESLGWSPYLRDEGVAAQRGMNLYGWPHDLVDSIRREVVWLHPEGGGEGSVAVMSLGVAGRDFRETAQPPNVGWAALRLWSATPSTTGDNRSSTPFYLAPYGCVVMSSALDPENVRLEALHGADTCTDAP